MKSTLSKKILPICILLSFLLPGCTKIYQIGDGGGREGYISGAVLGKGASSKNGPIAGAEIEANVITIKMHQIKMQPGTDNQSTGLYWISGPPGTYTLQVSAPRFEPKSVDVKLEAGKMIKKDIELTPVPPDSMKHSE